MGRSDRVEELETRVRELEATVTGLTDELLECKQRLAELEDGADAETDVVEGSLTSDASSSESSTDSSAADSSSILDEVDTYTDAEDESGSETETESDGIIVA